MDQAFAQRVFALADFRRFLLAFKVVSNEDASSTELESKLWHDYSEVASALRPWSRSREKLLGEMCDKSLTRLGVVACGGAETAANGLGRAKMWYATPFASAVSSYVHFIQQSAYNLQIGTHSLFGRLSGSNAMAPLNKAMIISELVARADYNPANAVRIGDLEERVGQRSYVIHDHLLYLKKFSLVAIEESQSEPNKGISYSWASPNPPPEMPPSNKRTVVYAIYEAKGCHVPASHFYSLYEFPSGVRAALKGFVDSGQIERSSSHFLRKVQPTQKLVDVAERMVNPVLGAIGGEMHSLLTVLSGAREFGEGEREKLLFLAQRYVTESKII